MVYSTAKLRNLVSLKALRQLFFFKLSKYQYDGSSVGSILPHLDNAWIISLLYQWLSQKTDERMSHASMVALKHNAKSTEHSDWTNPIGL